MVDTIVVVQALMIKNEMRKKRAKYIWTKEKQRVVASEMAETEAEWHEQQQQ